MADINGVSIQKGKIGANTLSQDDAVSAIISTGASTAKLQLNKPTVVYNIKDVESLDINPLYDQANAVNLYRHLSEFFRLAPTNTELYLMVVDSTSTMSEACEAAKKLLPFAKGKIRQLAISVNPSTITLLNGIPEELFNAIPVAQNVALWAYDNHMPLQILLEGFGYSGGASSTQNLREIPNLNADKVSVFIGQDYEYAQTLTGNLKKFADIGSALGLTARAFVNQNIGNNNDPNFNLTDATKKVWLEPALSSGQKNDEAFEDLQTLEDKGFLFGLEYAGLAGVRINNDHTCTVIFKDQDNSTNEHSIALGRVHDKAVRALRIAYLPYINTDWAIEPTTGKLAPAVVRAMEDVGNQVFQNMVDREEISLGDTIVDKDSDLLIEKSLNVGFRIVPKGTISEIKGTINLKTQL